MRIATRTMQWASPLEKARTLEELAQKSALYPEVRELAVAIVEGAGASSAFEAAEAIHHFVRSAIHYREDPNNEEEFADAKVVLQRGYDDCDGKALLFVALCRSIGLEAHTKPLFVVHGASSDAERRAALAEPRDNRAEFVHVQAEVRAPGFERLPFADDQGWVLAELILPGVVLGQGSEAMVFRGAHAEV